MSLVVSIGGKIESYYSFKKTNVRPVAATDTSNRVVSHEDDQESLDKHSPSNHKASHIIQHSYGKQSEPHHRVTHVSARDIMSSPVHAITKLITVREALKKLHNLNCHHLLVCEKDLILGIISDRDLLKYSLNHEYLDKEVAGIMTTEVILAKEDADIKVLANIMLTEKISSIPIVNEAYQLEGIVTHTDLLRCLMNNMPLDILI
jgi:CBS domain-containing protein